MRISPEDFKDATRLAAGIVTVLYGAAGILIGFSTRRIALPAPHYLLALLAALLLCNLIIRIFQRITLPKAEAGLNAAIAARDGEGFARFIMRREIARLAQPWGGLAFSIGFLAEITLRHLWA